MTFRLDHLHLWSGDPAAAARTYVDLFAAEQIAENWTPNGLRIVLRLAEQNLFIEQAPSERLGVEHFALITESFDAVVAELRAKGARFLVEPKQSGPGLRLAFVEGPDGQRIEIVERLAET